VRQRHPFFDFLHERDTPEERAEQEADAADHEADIRREDFEQPTTKQI
jgi:hypothetical protein